MWLPLSGPPYAVTPGATYAFTLVAPGTMTSSAVSSWLSMSTTPAAVPGVSAVTVAPGNNWNVVSITPGHTSGLYRSYQIIATWTGPAMTIGAASSDPTIPSYANMDIWAVDTSQPQATPENTPEPVAPPGTTPGSTPAASSGWGTWWFVGGVALGLGGLYLLSRAQREGGGMGQHQYGRENPMGRPMTNDVVIKIRRDARAAYADLRDEGQSELDAEFSAYENVYDEYVDAGYSSEDVASALTQFRSRASDDSAMRRNTEG